MNTPQSTELNPPAPEAKNLVAGANAFTNEARSPAFANRLVRQIQVYAKVQYVLAAIIAVALGAFYIVVYRPQSADIAELNRQIAEKQQELASDRSQTNRLPAVAGELDRLNARLAGFKELPPDPQFGPFIHDISGASQQAKLRKFTDQPGEVTRDDLYSEMPVTLTFQGDFASVFTFIRHVEDMDRLTRVRDVQIKSIDSTLGTVDVTLTVNIYYSEAG